MAAPMIPHRGPAMQALLARIQPILRDVFQTTHPVHTVTAPATAVMEPRSGISQPRVLAVTGGAFRRPLGRDRACLRPQRHHAACGGIAAHRSTQARRGAAGRAVRPVTVVHSETSTGVLAPLDGICEVTGGILTRSCWSTAVSSMGAVPIATDSCDFVLTASQKCLALPPGLSFFAIAPRALDRARKMADRGVAFDFDSIDHRTRAFEPVFTPAIPILFAADAGLARLAAETVKVRHARHRACAELARPRVRQTLSSARFDERVEDGFESAGASRPVPDAQRDIAQRSVAVRDLESVPRRRKSQNRGARFPRSMSSDRERRRASAGATWNAK